MRKAYGRINKKFTILCGIVLVVIVGVIVVCVVLNKDEKKDLPDYSITDPAFVDYFSNDDDIDEKRVSSLRSYYLYGKTYYVVEYAQDGEYLPNGEYVEDGIDYQYELLYILMGPSKTMYFPIKDESDCYTYFPGYYADYLNAKKNGISREYSAEEIAEIINSYYGRTIVQ